MGLLDFLDEKKRKQSNYDRMNKRDLELTHQEADLNQEFNLAKKEKKVRELREKINKTNPRDDTLGKIGKMAKNIDYNYMDNMSGFGMEPKKKGKKKDPFDFSGF